MRASLLEIVENMVYERLIGFFVSWIASASHKFDAKYTSGIDNDFPCRLPVKRAQAQRGVRLEDIRDVIAKDVHIRQIILAEREEEMDTGGTVAIERGHRLHEFSCGAGRLIARIQEELL